MGVLKKAAISYKAKYSKTPVVFIGGVDILAKRNKELCEMLIIKAKILANSNTVRTVLISSEGFIILYFENEKLSAANRALIYEVGGLTKKEGLNYLMENGVALLQTAKKSVKCVGGRLVYLQNVLTLNNEELKSVDLCGTTKRIFKCTRIIIN